MPTSVVIPGEQAPGPEPFASPGSVLYSFKVISPKALALHTLSPLRRAKSKCSWHWSIISVPLTEADTPVHPDAGCTHGEFCTWEKIVLTSLSEIPCNPAALALIAKSLLEDLAGSQWCAFLAEQTPWN